MLSVQKNITIKTLQELVEYQIHVGNNLLENCGQWIEESSILKPNKIAIVSNSKIFRLYGDFVKISCERAGFQTFVCLIPNGEKYKNFKTLKKILDFLSENKLRRNDAVIALGGGVIGDLTGFASAIYLRGIRFFQVPTTLLAMIDSSVGGKTGIDTEFGKNLVGAFHQPSGVLVDIRVLKTLPRREITSGFCEAIKQGALSGTRLLEMTSTFLENFPVSRFRTFFADENFLSELAELIAAQIAFKAQIVSEDEREEVTRSDKSRKFLNFGHTIAHAIEKVTNYSFKHGEAVGIGILVEAEISKLVANFPETDLKLLSEVVGLVGKLPPCHNIEKFEVIQAIKYDKKNIKDELEWVLLKEIGKPFISRDVSEQTIMKSLEKVFARSQLL